MAESPTQHVWSEERDEQNRQQCQTCGKWQWVFLHSCSGVKPQPVSGTARPADASERFWRDRIADEIERQRSAWEAARRATDGSYALGRLEGLDIARTIASGPPWATSVLVSGGADD